MVSAAPTFVRIRSERGRFRPNLEPPPINLSQSFPKTGVPNVPKRHLDSLSRCTGPPQCGAPGQSEALPRARPPCSRGSPLPPRCAFCAHRATRLAGRDSAPEARLSGGHRRSKTCSNSQLEERLSQLPRKQHRQSMVLETQPRHSHRRYTKADPLKSWCLAVPRVTSLVGGA